MAKKIINVVYKVDDKELSKAKTSIQGVEKETKDAEREMVKLDKAVQKTGSDASKSFGNFNSVLKTISFAAIGASVFALGKKIFDLGVKQEQLNIAFNTFLGSAAKGKKLLQELTKFSIVTPFSPDQVNAAAKALLAFGVKGDEVIPTLKMLGDVSAGTGKDLAEMSVIFGQIRSTGRLMGQDLLQLINAGFNPLQVISEKTGKSMRSLKDDMEKGKISFEQVSDAFKTATSEGGLFFNLMQKQSESIGGVMSTIGGNIEEGFKNIFAAQSGPIKEFVDQLQTLSEAFLEFTKSDQQIIDEKEVELIDDATKAYDLYNKAFGDSNAAREKVIGLINQQKKALTEQAEVQTDILNREETIAEKTVDVQKREFEKNAAREKLTSLNTQWEAYEDKVIPALDEYILKSGLAAKATTDEGTALKLTNAQLKAQAAERKKALDAINKQIRQATGGQTRAEDEADDEKKSKKQSDAIGRELEQDKRRSDLKIANDADMEAEKVRIAEEAAQKRIDIAKKEEEQKAAAIKRSYDLAIQLGAALLENALMQREVDTQAISEKYERELELAGDNDKAKKDIELKRDQELKIAEIRNKETQKRNARTKIGIDTAVAIIKTMAEFGYPAGLIPSALMAAFGAVQLANVRKFKKGEVSIDGPGTGTSDSIPAMISKGESVITAEATGRSRKLLEAINERKIDDRVLKGASDGGGRQATVLDLSPVVNAIERSRTDYEQHGYTLMKSANTGRNFKRIMKAKIQGY